MGLSESKGESCALGNAIYTAVLELLRRHSCVAEAQEADLSEAVRDAIILALPNGALCGEPTCLSTAQRGVGLSGQRSGWVSASSRPASAVPGGSQFAKLQLLKQQL